MYAGSSLSPLQDSQKLPGFRLPRPKALTALACLDHGVAAPLPSPGPTWQVQTPLPFLLSKDTSWSPSQLSHILTYQDIRHFLFPSPVYSKCLLSSSLKFDRMQ